MRVSPLLAAVAALALVAAESPTPPAGTASTRLTAIEVAITGVPDAVSGLTVLDLSTFASTDRDTARNPKGAPFAAVDLRPAVLGGTDLVPPVSVRSDGQQSLSTSVLDQDLGAVSAALGSAGLQATATEDSAQALVSAVTAEVGVLEDLLGFSVEQVPVATRVNGTQSSATTAIHLSALDLDLAGLLPVDLSDLPLDVILDLADLLSDQLGGLAPDLVAALDAAVAALQSTLAQLSQVLGSYESTAAELEEALTELQELEAALGDLQALRAEAETLLAGAPTDDDVTDLTGDVDDALDAVGDLLGGLGGTLGGGLSGAASLGALAQSDPVADLNGLIADLDASIAEVTGALDDQQTAVDGLVAQVQGLLDQIVALLGDLGGLLDELVGALEDLLAILDDVVDDLGLASLLEIDPISVGVAASATRDAASASVTCGGGEVAVAGVTVVPSIDACDTVAAVGDQLTSALGALRDVLGTLTSVEVPTPTLELFTARSATTGTDGPARTAAASIEVLRLEVPSVSLDDLTSDAASDLLDSLTGLDIGALLGDVEEVLGGDATGLIGTVGGLAGELQATLDEVTGAVQEVVDVEGILDELAGAVDDLVGGVIPDGLATPGIQVVVDPSADARYAPGAPAAPPQPPAAPAAPPTTSPSTTPAPTSPLPATGGGVALLALAALGAATALRRRRD